jgi:vesicle-associated membrane protein 7
MASIIYCVIASDSPLTPLAEVATAEGNFNVVCQKILQKIRIGSSASYVYENKYIFHYNNENGFTFLCMTDSAFNNRTAYTFLFDIKDRFFEKYGNNLSDLKGYSINREFAEIIRSRITFFNNETDYEKISAVKKNIGVTMDIMKENLEKILDRGEKLEILVNKTSGLSDSSISMKKNVRVIKATKVKRHMWWKNIKYTLLLIFLIFVSDI